MGVRSGMYVAKVAVQCFSSYTYLCSLATRCSRPCDGMPGLGPSLNDEEIILALWVWLLECQGFSRSYELDRDLAIGQAVSRNNQQFSALYGVNRCEGNIRQSTLKAFPFSAFLGYSAVILLIAHGVEIPFYPSWCSKLMTFSGEDFVDSGLRLIFVHV